MSFTESIVEQAALDWLSELGYSIKFGPDIASDGFYPERSNYAEVILPERLGRSLRKINPGVTTDSIEDAVRKLTIQHAQDLIQNNHAFQRMLSDGITVEAKSVDGSVRHEQIWLFDFKNSEANDWLAVNQFTIIEDNRERRPDIVIFVNGLPLGVIELKNPADVDATIEKAYNQLQTYKKDIPSLFYTNEVLVTSDGTQARIGSFSADNERFMPWRTIEGSKIATKGVPELDVLIKGVFEHKRFLDIIRNFVVFAEDKGTFLKKLAGYHQYNAVNIAVDSTLKATSPKGDKRVGVVWHTQGSGKSLTMAFYAGKIIQEPKMANPTIVVITDRNDLDQQLFDEFSFSHEVLRQTPVRSESRAQLKELLRVASGGVVFTTIQKFLPEKNEESFPLLSDRRNIVVIADEAHRSQYEFIHGFARHMRDALPNASFIAFTGTPLELADRSTKAVFGDYIDIYDIQRAVEDKFTVPIYYEARLAKLKLKEDERPKIDKAFEEITEDQEAQVKERLRGKWARLEAIVGAEKRIKEVAEDIVSHFEARDKALKGKGMIVCMSRRICVELYDQIVKLRPEWHSQDDDKGTIKVVMTGSATDPPEFHPHVRNKLRRKALQDRLKDPKDSLKLAIVRDMWLTGFDAPPLHTMYVDKPMRGHGLMQAIARVNRVFKDKPGGLVVDYIGIGYFLKEALANYTREDREDVGVPQEQAVAVMMEKYEICKAMFHRFDYSKFFTGKATEKISVVPAALEHILAQDDGKNRFLKNVMELSKAFALSVPNEKALKIRDELGFFQAIRAQIVKYTPSDTRAPAEIDTAIRQVVSEAIGAQGIVDIFDAAGLKRPDVSPLMSDQFLNGLKKLQHKNLALELLKKLINDELKLHLKKNMVQSKLFSDMLDESIRKYQNRSVEAAEVIQELIELAKQMREANKRGEKLGLSEEELAFYDALEVNDSAVKVLGDETLRTIATELVKTVRENTSIDWTVKENVRAKLRVAVRRLLRKYDYPPDKQEKATQTVLQQAELVAKDWYS
ncbi:MAG: type I restriction endonuclease subunit R [Nitrososphaerota archaeon]|nr:type I restriction endonuclease subunit R [Nitrososphaerota archaeon]